VIQSEMNKFDAESKFDWEDLEEDDQSFDEEEDE
jgi:hypothetical protein